ncbi:MAG: iron-sulfur cluster assembly accessory protein [Methylococcales bacterium]
MSNIQFNHTITDEIKVSPDAVKQLIAVTESETGAAGIRIFVHGGGCGGMEYGMTLVDQAQSNQYDCVLQADGMNIYVDAIALGFLSGVEIDYQTQGVNESFVFKNAFTNSGGTGTCGTCGAVGGGCG